MHNHMSVKTTFKDVMMRESFQKGFNEFRAGLPYDYDGIVNLNDQASYERGRKFAILYSGRLRQGRGIHKDALATYSALRKSKDIL